MAKTAPDPAKPEGLAGFSYALGILHPLPHFPTACKPRSGKENPAQSENTSYVSGKGDAYDDHAHDRRYQQH